MCGLNANHLVRERAKRAEYLVLLKQKAILVRRGLHEVGELIQKFRHEVELMIPEIPFAPGQ